MDKGRKDVIEKAIGILIVVGHASMPIHISIFIYMFHMPLFLV